MKHTKMQILVLITVICISSALISCLYLATANAALANLTKIMGEGELSPEEMYAYLSNNNKQNGLNPLSPDYMKGFVEITFQEAKLEGVRSDIAFCLMMHETGFLNFGGDVQPDQNNFGGLGAVGGGVKGAQFDSARFGIRAVIQHLKCYASNDGLSMPLADPRWSESLRGKAEYIEWLGYSDNPNGTGWAMPGEGYGSNIVSMIAKAKALDVSGIEPIAIRAYDPSGIDPYASLGASQSAAAEAETEQEVQSPKGFFLSLLDLSAKNVMSFTIALFIFLCLVGIARFRSKYL